MINNPLHIPALRLGKFYESLDKTIVADHRTGQKLIELSQVNTGLIRKDLPKYAGSRPALRRFSTEQLLTICQKAGQLFMEADLPLSGAATQSPDEYVRRLSASSGLPHVMVRANMKKIHFLFTEMRAVLRGLMRGLDWKVLDSGVGEQDGAPVSYYPLANVLGVVLPSNSPGVNSLWMPAIALKIPVVLKPGREEPWTPYRIIQAFIAAGVPAEAFGFYPCDHDGAAEILNSCGRSLLFGDESTTARWANNPGVQIHGPGRSKVLIGEDCIERWREYLDVIVHAISENGGRSCVNASALIVPRHGREIAEELARRLGPVQASSPEDANAKLSAFANVKMADWINESIEEGLKTPGAVEVTAAHRNGPRKQIMDGGTYLRPAIVHCESFEHPLANREFLFPYASVVEIPQKEMLSKIGHSLVVTAITADRAWIDALLASPLIDRLNIGPISTMKVAWDQPHEGNLFEFLYRRRAIVIAYPSGAKEQAGSTACSLPSPATHGKEQHTAAAPWHPQEPLRSFDFHPRTKIVFGPNAIATLGALVKEHSGRRVLLVTDTGIVKAGHAVKALESLSKAGLTVALFDGVRMNPTEKDVAVCTAAARAHETDFFVGLGGGSSMDTAKGANFIFTNGGRMADYWGINKAAKPLLPLIAVPTTAGTGSECQSFALISDDATHQKMACGDEKAYPRVALLDPCLTLTLPRRITANTGIDALAHALETYVCNVRTPLSQLFSREAWRLGERTLEIVLDDPTNLRARGEMLLASAYAGMAIAQSMLGAAHAAANPLTARFNVVHGQAVGVMLPLVIRFNSASPEAAALYHELAVSAKLARHETAPEAAVSALINRLNELLRLAEIPTPSLKDCGIRSDSLPALSDEAAKQWTAGFNPRPISAKDFVVLYEAALKP